MQRPSDMFDDKYGRLAATLWEYLEEQAPNHPDMRDVVHEETLRVLDDLLRAGGIEAT